MVESQSNTETYNEKFLFELTDIQNGLQGIIHQLATLNTYCALHDDNDQVIRLSNKTGELAELLEGLR